jgi:hypothetical protein
MRTGLSGTFLTADLADKKGRNRPSMTRATVPETIKSPSRRSRTRKSDVP